ncbi:hypothetical protein FRX31_009440 [Thalictrum thalictroides]|uniref:Uncharacterized protein n=1 Tax=Thalictrum thalictroides TaxID=46969 RepID=A0A7J6WU79_THATH|nr:hypothetical protein FRX31_009440 [Thalictrum thalictroides]
MDGNREGLRVLFLSYIPFLPWRILAVHALIVAEICQRFEMSNGWPLGLENMNLRLRVVESLQVAPSEIYHPYRVRSTSFSSFTSSDLDTESTKSFFNDGSVSLGRIIRIRPGDGDLYFTANSFHHRERRQVNGRSAPSDSFRSHHEVTVSRGSVCIPLLQCFFVKTKDYQSK